MTTFDIEDFELFPEPELTPTWSAPPPPEYGPPLEFVFGSRTLRLPPGRTIATQIWQSAFVTACYVHRGSFLEEGHADELPSVAPVGDTELASVSVLNKRVLEVGCGSGLAGLIAGLHGAASVTFTDCDDEALTALGEHLREHLRRTDHHVDVPDQGFPPPCRSFRVFHHLWEQDGELEGAPELPHWCNARRRPMHPDCVAFDGESADNLHFDVVLAADCLYFPSQEAPLAAVLKKRLRRPVAGVHIGGVALVVIQTRGNGGFQAVRFKELLEQSGFRVRNGAPLGSSAAELLLAHVRRPSADDGGPQEEDIALHGTGAEVAQHVLMVTWGEDSC